MRGAHPAGAAPARRPIRETADLAAHLAGEGLDVNQIATRLETNRDNVMRVLRNCGHHDVATHLAGLSRARPMNPVPTHDPSPIPRYSLAQCARATFTVATVAGRCNATTADTLTVLTVLGLSTAAADIKAARDHRW